MLEPIIIPDNMKREPSKKINTTKIKLLCETRWIQKRVVLAEIHMLYEPLLKTLEKITTERGWDNKATGSAHSLMKSLTDPTFLVALNMCSCVLGFTKPSSIMLQATAMDVITAYQNIRLVKEQQKTLRDNTNKVYEGGVWTRDTKLCTIAEVELTSPRVCGRMTRRTNVLSATPQEYYKIAVFKPTIHHLISELEYRFSSMQVNATCGLYLTPQHLDTMKMEHRDNAFSFFEWALPTPETFNQEIEV